MGRPHSFNEVAHMVDRGRMLRIARRYDTAMSRAMLRARGFGPAPRRKRARGGGNAHRQADRARYQARRWCFENHGSPLR